MTLLQTNVCHILFRDCHCPGDKDSIIILGPQGNKRATSQPWLRGDVGSWAPHMSPWETVWDRVALLPGYHHGNPSVQPKAAGEGSEKQAMRWAKRSQFLNGICEKVEKGKSDMGNQGKPLPPRLRTSEDLRRWNLLKEV